MNNNFMFSPNLNPYADNAKFIKKTMKSRHSTFMAVGISVMLTCLLYGAIFSFSMAGGDGTLFETKSDKVMQTVSFCLFGVRTIFMIILLAMLCIGIVNFIMHLKDKDGPLLPNSFAVLCNVFLISVLIYCIMMFFASFAQLGLTLLFLNYENTDDFVIKLANIFMLDTVSSMVWIIWAISGIVFFSSVRNTFKCVMLSDKGSAFFITASIFTPAVTAICVILYNVNDFEAGMFYLYDGSTALSDAIIGSSTAILMFNVFFIASIITVIAAACFASDYRKAIRSAQRSFSYAGSNLYMNGDSAAAAYFQGYYSSPAGGVGSVNNAAAQAPQPVQPDPPPQIVQNGEFSRIDFTESDIGSDLPKEGTIICPLCGAKIMSRLKYCTECGNSLNL